MNWVERLQINDGAVSLKKPLSVKAVWLRKQVAMPDFLLLFDRSTPSNLPFPVSFRLLIWAWAAVNPLSGLCKKGPVCWTSQFSCQICLLSFFLYFFYRTIHISSGTSFGQILHKCGLLHQRDLGRMYKPRLQASPRLFSLQKNFKAPFLLRNDQINSSWLYDG